METPQRAGGCAGAIFGAQNHPAVATSSSDPRKPYRPKKRTNWSQIFIIGLMGLALLSFILTSIPGAGGGAPPPPPVVEVEPERPELPPLTEPAVPPVFTDEGDLAIYRDGQDGPLAKLDIEFAVTEEDIRQGLMWRREMAADQGMLFLMAGEEPRSFWMKNTYIPLDIIFVGSDKRIVSIQPNTTPMSEAQVLSNVPAAYVLEVNAGYADRYGLAVGDVLEWN